MILFSNSNLVQQCESEAIFNGYSHVMVFMQHGAILLQINK